MNSDLIKIASYDNVFEAELAKGLLEDSGIEVTLDNEHIMSIYPSFAFDMFRVELKVPLSKAETAGEILASYTDAYITQAVLKEEKALLEGHFLLTSGRHSAQYIEKIRILQNPQKAVVICHKMAERLKDYAFDAVVGPAYGGIVLAYEIAKMLQKPFVFTQRKDDKMVLRDGFDLTGIKKAAIVEDIITTGGSIREVIDCLKHRDIETAVIGAVVDRSGGAVEFGYPQEVLLCLEIPSWSADECELCREGIALTKPGSSDKKTN